MTNIDVEIPELRLLNEAAKAYVDPLPWDPILGALGIPEEGFQVGEEFLRITSLLQFLPAPALIKWAAKMAAVRAWKVGPVYQFWDLEGAFIADCRDAGDRIRDEAATRGTAVHDLAEEGADAVNSALIALLDGHHHGDLAPEALPYVESLKKFQVEYAAIGAKIIWSEVAVYSRRCNVAGRGDLIMWLPGRGMYLVDIKTSRHILHKYDLQTWFYQNADYGIVDARRIPLPPIQGRVILWIKDDGEYEMVEQEQNEVDPAEVLRSLQCIRKWETSGDRRKVWPSPSTWGVSTIPNAGNDLQFLTITEVDLALVAARRADQTRAAQDGFKAAFDDEELAWVVAFEAWHEQRVQWLPAWGDPGRWVVTMYQTWLEGTPFDAANRPTRELVNRLGTMAGCLAYWEGVAESYSTPHNRVEAPFLNETDRPTHPGAMMLAEMEQELAAWFPTGVPRFEELEPAAAQYIIDTVVSRKAPVMSRPDRLGELVLSTPNGDRSIIPARRGTSTDPQSFTRPDMAIVNRTKALLERLRSLPPDMQEAISAAGVESGMPYLLTWTATERQLTLLDRWISELEGEADERIAYVDQLVMDLIPEGSDEEQTLFMNALMEWSSPKGVVDVAMADPHQVDICRGICIGLRIQALAAVLDDLGKLQLVSTTSEPQLVAWFGSASKARKEAKRAVELVELPSYGRSAREIAEQPLTVAAIMLILDDDVIEKKAAAARAVAIPITPEAPVAKLLVDTPTLEFAALLADPSSGQDESATLSVTDSTPLEVAEPQTLPLEEPQTLAIETPALEAFVARASTHQPEDETPPIFNEPEEPETLAVTEPPGEEYDVTATLLGLDPRGEVVTPPEDDDAGTIDPVQISASPVMVATGPTVPATTTLEAILLARGLTG